MGSEALFTDKNTAGNSQRGGGWFTWMYSLPGMTVASVASVVGPKKVCNRSEGGVRQTQCQWRYHIEITKGAITRYR